MLRAQAQSQSKFQSQSQMLLGSLPGSCSDLSQFVSLSASRVGDEMAGGVARGRIGGAAAVHFPLACLCFCYSFILICLPLRFIFLRFFALSAPLHPFSFFFPHFVSHFSCSFNLENSEKRAQSNKIKLGFIDPFQFDSLTPPLPSSLCIPFFPALSAPSSFSFAHPLAVLSVLLWCNN